MRARRTWRDRLMEIRPVASLPNDELLSPGLGDFGRNGRSGEILGHPTCLFTLFFAEMWERFSFYGMKALLILYMVNYLFWRQADASHVFAWYAGLVYATPVLGGMIADRWLGARWSVVIGGVIIAIGHFLLAFEPMPFFYSGLGCLIVGTGFLKPNISTQVGALYRQSDERRDSAFTIFYMGINLGALAGPIVCGWLQLSYGYHYGFAAAGVGMVAGLIVYIAGMGSVVRRSDQIVAEDEAGESDPQEPAAPAVSHKVVVDRCVVLVVICVFAILFWVGFEQAANVMNLWADQHTNMHIFHGEAPATVVPDANAAVSDLAVGPTTPTGDTWKDWRMGAAMTQSINPLFIVTLAAVFAWFWQYLERRKCQPSTPFKMAFGFFFLSVAYGILLLAVQAEGRGTSAPLAVMPAGISVDEDGTVHSMIPTAGGGLEREDYGATRLKWADGTLKMNGVLSDLDWMRALGQSATAIHKDTIDELAKLAEERLEEVKAAKRAGEMARDATWEVQITVPDEAGEIRPTTGLPKHVFGREEKYVVDWDPDTRVLTVTDTLTDRDKAQLLAAGADPHFRDALTKIFEESSVLKVSIIWLLAFYMVLTIGELCLSPVGLSLVTKAAPPKYVGLFMGLWFFTTGFIANYAAHTVGGMWGTMTPSAYFMIFGIVGIFATVLMLLLLRVLKPMLHGVH